MKARKKAINAELNASNSNNIINVNETIIYAKLSSTKETKSVFDALKDALKNMTLKFIKPIENHPNSGGLSITAFDKITRALIKVRVPASTFSVFVVNSDDEEESSNEICASINVKVFTMLLKQADNNDVMTWYIHKEEKDNFVFIFENLSKNLINQKKIKLLNLPKEDFKIPTTEFICKLSILSEDFHKYVKDSSSTTDKIRISFYDTKDTQNTIVMKGSGNFADTECIITDKTEGVTIEKYFEEDTDIYISGQYSLKNLCMFIKCQAYCAYVELLLKENYPLIVKYDIEDYGHIYLIIPSVDENDGTNDLSDSDSDSEDEKPKLRQNENNDEPNEYDDEEEQDEDEEEDD